jgi:hypothetical protein
MKPTCLTAIWLSLASSFAFAVETFYVAPDGSDANPGSRGRPFATFHRVQQAARAARISHPDQGVTVVFKAGRHDLDRPVEFTAVDSGRSADQPVRYMGEPGKEVIVSGV